MRTGFWWASLMERVNLEDLVVDGMIRLNLCCSPNIIRVSRCRRMRWAGYVERMDRGKMRRGFGGET